MAILDSEIKFYKSTEVDFNGTMIATGGAIDKLNPVDTVTTLHNLFDWVKGAEAENGMTDYRCIYVSNDNTSETLFDVRLVLTVNTPHVNTHVQIGAGTAGTNTTEQVIADELTAPVGVTFSDHEVEGVALNLGDIPPDGYHAIWIKREVTAGATPLPVDAFQIQIIGETLG